MRADLAFELRSLVTATRSLALEQLGTCLFEPPYDELHILMQGFDLTWAAAHALLKLGVPAATVAHLHAQYDLALAKVTLGRSGTFEFGGPDRRLLLSVRERGRVVDIVAVSATDVNGWALYRKVADFLGEDLLTRAVIEEWRQLRLFATPLDWLRGGGAGVCVLDWSPSALSALRGLRETTTIICDAGDGSRLRALLAFGGLPRVAETNPMRRVL